MKQNVRKLNKTQELKAFRFGGGETLTLIASLELPGIKADRKVIIKTDVVTSAIPLSLSMKKAGVKLDLVNERLCKNIRNTHSTQSY